MKNKFITLAILLLFMQACITKQKETASSSAEDSVEVFLLQRVTVQKTLSLPAELLPWERTEIYAKVEGYVRERKVDIGDLVKKGDILVTLDAPEVTANYVKSSAELQAAYSKYSTSVDLYKRTLLAAKEKGTVTDSELERIRNQMLADSATHEAAKSSANANAQLKNYLIIRAAFDGVVTQRNVDAGSLVGNNQESMLILENISKLRLHVAIPEAYTSAASEPSVSFTVDAHPSKKYQAMLVRKSNHIDEKTRTELWEFEVANINSELKSGMYANVNINLKRNEPTFAVPYSSVVTTLEKRFVVRLNKGEAEWIDVRNGITTNDKVEIFGNLQEGDLLLTKANDEVKEGSFFSNLKIKKIK